MSTIDNSGNLHIAGTLTAYRFQAPAGSITNAAIATVANDGVDAAKLEHQHQPVHSLANHGVTPTAVRRVIHVVVGATATLIQFQAGPIQAVTAGSISIDLLKNGTTILTAAISLTTGTGTAFAKVDPAGYTSTSLVVDDVLEANVTVSGLTGGGGLWCQLNIREDAS